MLSGIIAKTTEFPLQLIGSVAGVSTARGGSDDDKAKRARRCFKREHMSVFEHVSVTWRIEGISRACSHQLVRHRLASFCQLSQRYVVVNTDADWYVIPPSIRDDDRMLEEYASEMWRCAEYYKSLLDDGMKPDKATNRWDVIVNYLADLIEPQPIDGNTSDGYHTFDELYHHRAVLFSVIVENFATRAWKSKLHADGTMYEGMFIVGIETPDGQATYHYDVEPYWNLFRCKEVDRAPEWDGHTPDQAIERIGKLVDCETDRTTTKRDDVGGIYWRCPRCGAFNRKDAVTDCCGVIPSRCCANCGAGVVE